MGDSSSLWFWGLIYALLLLALGGWASRRVRSERDFFLAGQRLGLWVAGITTMSAAFSGFVFLGGPGLMYAAGVSSLFICIPIGVTPVLLGWLLAVRLRLFAEAPDVLTIPDVVRRRYGGRAAPALAAVAVLLGSVGYLAAQLLATGILLRSVLGWDLGWSVMAGLALVLVYSVAGGMVAGVWTDLAQGLIMLLCAIAVFAVAMKSGGGTQEMSRAIAGSDFFGGSFLDPFGSRPVVAAASLYLVFSIGTLGQPQMLHKLMMVRDVGQLRWFPLVLGGSQVICLLVWLGIGLAVPAAVSTGVLAPLTTPDEAAPTFLAQLSPTALSGLVSIGVLAAIMSTGDSFLNLGAGAVVRDLPRAWGRAPASSLGRLRWATLMVGLAAGALAVFYGDLVALLGTFAFGVFAAGLAPALAVGLNWERVSRAAAVASISTGMTIAVGLEIGGRLWPDLWEILGMRGDLLPAAAALVVSFTVLFLVSWVDRAEREIEPFAAKILSS